MYVNLEINKFQEVLEIIFNYKFDNFRQTKFDTYVIITKIIGGVNMANHFGGLWTKKKLNKKFNEEKNEELFDYDWLNED